jgi:hypothetical protein
MEIPFRRQYPAPGPIQFVRSHLFGLLMSVRPLGSIARHEKDACHGIRERDNANGKAKQLKRS